MTYLKPNCKSWKTLYLSRNWQSHLCISFCFFIILLIFDNNDIGRLLLRIVLSSFLCIGITFAPSFEMEIVHFRKINLLAYLEGG